MSSEPRATLTSSGTASEVPSICVVICTRDRPELLRGALRALARQTDQAFDTTVVAQGKPVSASALSDERAGAVRLIHDTAYGLSRARNLGWRATEAEWVAYVDDDCVLAPDWMQILKRTTAERADCSFVAGRVRPLNAPDGPYLATGVTQVRAARVGSGRWRRPLSLGCGACMVVRRSTIAELGGWDERLGAGAEPFPAAEDEDFIYRMLRRGVRAYVTPSLRAGHEQWRPRGEIAPLFRGYMRGRGGVATKHMRSGDAIGGLWLLSVALLDCLVLLGSAPCLRSRFRLGVGWASFVGLLIGVRDGWRAGW